jgi:hypothetical protein
MRLFGGIGVAYVARGPMWRREGEEAEPEVLRSMLKALRSEYVSRRRLLLHVVPKSPRLGAEKTIAIYEEEGFRWKPDPQRTIFLDLTPPLEVIRKNLGRSWRRSLVAGGKEDIRIVEGTGDALCRAAVGIVREMQARKQFVEFSDVGDFIAAHRNLPEELKLHVAVAYSGEEPIATLGWPRIGRIGVPLIGGTGNKALKPKASFLLWWRMVEDLKERGFDRCDLAGVNEEQNPGGYFFKSGLAGKDSGSDAFIGQFQAANSRLALWAVGTAEAGRSLLRKCALRLKRGTRAAKAPETAGAPCAKGPRG